MGLFKRRDRKRKNGKLMTDAVYDAALGEAYTIRFLFAEKPQMPDREIVQRSFEKKLHSSLRYMDPLSGELTVISSQKETWAFAVEEQELAMGEERSWYQIILSEIYKLNQYT